MRYNLYFVLALVSALPVFCLGQLLLRSDTLMAGGKPIALLKRSAVAPFAYSVFSFSGARLLDLHNAHIELKGKVAYLLTFPDRRQAMIVKKAPFPLPAIAELMKNKVIAEATIDTFAESVFIKTHPLPDGYTDVDLLIEY